MIAVRAAILAAAVLAPETALACATCAFSAYGDRSYNIAFLGLILLPFAVVGVVGGLIVRDVRRSRRAAAADAADRELDWPSATIEERT